MIAAEANGLLHRIDRIIRHHDFQQVGLKRGYGVPSCGRFAEQSEKVLVGDQAGLDPPIASAAATRKAILSWSVFVCRGNLAASRAPPTLNSAALFLAFPLCYIASAAPDHRRGIPGT